MSRRIVLEHVPEEYAGTIVSEIAALLESIYVPVSVSVADTAGWSEDRLAELRRSPPAEFVLRVEKP